MEWIRNIFINQIILVAIFSCLAKSSGWQLVSFFDLSKNEKKL
jgi:hypothetical protein